MNPGSLGTLSQGWPGSAVGKTGGTTPLPELNTLLPGKKHVSGGCKEAFAEEEVSPFRQF